MHRFDRAWRKAGMPEARVASERRSPARGWRVLVFVIAAIAAVTLAEGGFRPAWAQKTACRPGSLSGDAVINITNNERARKGLAPLDENPVLNALAKTRARDMLEKQYLSHVSPTGERASDIAGRVGYKYELLSENIASGIFCTNRDLVDCWMQSPGHRNNILSIKVRETGASVVKGKMNGMTTWVCVQIFGAQTWPAPEEMATLIKSLRETRREIDAERECLDRDIRVSAGDPARRRGLNPRIRAYNDKAGQYNRSLATVRATDAEPRQ